MDTCAPAPRVNGELLARFVGRKVLLVGKAESLEGGVMRMRTSDDRVVSVELKGGAAGYGSDFVEFEAVVKSADSVREEEHTSFGSAFGAPRLPRRRTLGPAVRRTREPLQLRWAHPAATGPRADMGNYDSLVKLIHGEAQALFF